MISITCILSIIQDPRYHKLFTDYGAADDEVEETDNGCVALDVCMFNKPRYA